MASTCKIVGLEKIFKNLTELGNQGVEAMNDIVIKTLADIARLAAIWAPKRQGKYKQGFAVKMVGNRKGDKMSGIVAPFIASGSIDPIGHLLEFGTAPHAVGKGSLKKITTGKTLEVVETRSGKMVNRWKSTTGEGKQTGGMHPGTKAQPHLFPAFEFCKAAMLEEIKAAILRIKPFR